MESKVLYVTTLDPRAVVASSQYQLQACELDTLPLVRWHRTRQQSHRSEKVLAKSVTKELRHLRMTSSAPHAQHSYYLFSAAPGICAPRDAIKAFTELQTPHTLC